MPTTPNRAFSIPATGTEVGVWGSNDLNPNFSAIDNILGSVTTINVGSGSVNLSATQQQVAVIRLTGTLAGNITVGVSQPAFWIVDNQATWGGFVVQIVKIGGSGNLIGPPPGTCQIAFDGTNVFFVNLGQTGSLVRFYAGGTPNWILASSISPYLPCQGQAFSGATFPALQAFLGGTTVPDLRGRAAFDLDPTGTRLTSTTMSPNGNTLGASGGAQISTIGAANLPQLSFSGTPGGISLNGANGIVSNTGPFTSVIGSGAVGIRTVNITANDFTPAGNVNVGSPNSAITNVPPALITGITFIKT